VYCSNESQYPVFFDNLQVVHNRGPILEETHYYPFGLTMAGISSKALNFGSPENKYKFNGIEQNNDFDLNMYDAFFRNLDPQIGRFWQIDPKPDYAQSLYSSMNNNPISFNDPLGDTAVLGINLSAALGFSHQILFYQDKNQNWYVYSMGAGEDEKGGDLVSGRTGDGRVELVPLTSANFKGLPEGKLTVNQLTSFLNDNKLGNTKVSMPITINTTQKQDEAIAANAQQSKKDIESGKEKYNLYTNNSTQATIKVLNKNTGLNLPTRVSPIFAHMAILSRILKQLKEKH
jgi:RHS repeat-associated protein